MNQPALTLTLPTDRLPGDPDERRHLLDSYFGDLLPTVSPTPAGWKVELRWPASDQFFVDPLLPRQLHWWRAGLTPGGIRQEVFESETGQMSLDDAWTLLAWSRWLARKREAGRLPGEVVVVHVDDHRDMMTPRVGWDGEGWRNLLSGDPFTVFDPDSVRSAVANGAVGIGSFFAPFVHEFPRVQVRHLSQSAAAAEVGREVPFARQGLPDTILRPGSVRPAIRLGVEDGGAPAPNGQGHAGTYRFTRNYDWCLSDMPDCPVLLHIDMDFFNNRYDRDSDWERRPARHDPDESAILAKIDELFGTLGEYGVAGRVENVSVALSPGFFPSEFWPASVARVEEHLSAMNVRLGRSVEPR